MKRHHSMPFGANLLDAGGVHFRLWAPGVATVGLRLDETQELPMAPAGSGWFELTVPTAHAGSRYSFRLPDGLLVPDPASRYNPDDIHGPSEVVDAAAFDWSDGDWRGRPWEEAVIYELHVGSFTPAGNFDGVIERLDYLADLGVTALEIMPLSDFPGCRNWGYDGVLPFAPDAAYGRPEDFKRLVDAAHERGMMVLLDVVYNHFGPEGNYLHAYAPDFFNPHHKTPWGAAINFDGENNRPVRDFFVHNVLYWLEEFHLDGLRLDAIHAICDDSSPDIIEEIAEAFRTVRGLDRHVHMVLENEHNQARYLGRDDRSIAPMPRRSGTTTFTMYFMCSPRVKTTATTPTTLPNRRGFWAAASPRVSPIRAKRRPSRTANCAANRAATCPLWHSSISCRTTTRSATAPSASA